MTDILTNEDGIALGLANIYPANPYGLSKRFIDSFGCQYRWCQELGNHGAWYVYSEETGCFILEKKEQVTGMMLKVAEVHDLLSPLNTGTHLKTATINSAISLSKPACAVQLDDFDQELTVMNFRNGLVDLRTGELMPHDCSTQLLKMVTDCEYDPDAPRTEWEGHLKVMVRNFPEEQQQELIDFIQVLVGLSLWGADDRDQIVPHLKGRGRQGKGVFLRAIKKALGSYGLVAPVNLLSMSEGAHTTEFTTLRNKRLAYNSEVGHKRLNLEVLKMISGGDEINAREIREKNPEVADKNTVTLWLASNHHLNTAGDSGDAFWERYIPIDLGAMIEEGKRENNIEQRLELELTGIMAWAVEGCIKWCDQGQKLIIPDFIRAERDVVKEESDPFGTFVSECLIITNVASDRVILTDVATRYKVWADHNSERLQMSSKNIAGDFRSRYGLDVKVAGRSKTNHAFGIMWNTEHWMIKMYTGASQKDEK